MRISKSILRSPARTTIIGFALLILMGTILLMLPAVTTGKPLGFVNALFTSTSAVCVTGLTVVDTGTAFSPFGQSVLLILIQTGGLGIMTLSTLFLMLARRRPGFSGQIMVQDTFTHSRERNISSILKDVVLLTFVIEGMGIFLMFPCFLPGHTAQQALFLSIFHSISAFCNAGFSVFSDSFVGYRENWALNLVVCFLIVSGGLGFLVLSEIRQKFLFKRRDLSRFSLHSKLVLSTTAILIVSGMFLIAAMDKDPILVQKIKDSVSQAVVADAADRKTVESLLIKEMDAAVVCIGTDLSASILVTLNLKDIGIQKIYAKAITDSHGRILRKVGADEILFPERDLAVSLAEKLNNPSVLDYLPFIEGYSIIELTPPDDFVGKDLKALDLINRYGVQVLAVKKVVSGQFEMIPTGKYVLKDDEDLILLGPNDALDSIRKKRA